jgi:murein DD-endopeptidase MepM/ murein hydrolase activator NlpD
MRSSFKENFVRVNHLQEHFEDWVFRPGMLFREREKWWGGGPRTRPHEGVDLRGYRDKAGNERFFAKETLVPVIYRGEIVKTEDDFIGQSVYVAHDHYAGQDRTLYTIYGHIRPRGKMPKGTPIGEGAIIGAIAEPAGGNLVIPAHLHITVALIAKSVRPENLGWKMMGDAAAVSLQDPLEIIS